METVTLPISLRELDSNLRNSLTGILGNARFLKEATLTTELKAYVEDILQSGNALLQLSNSLIKGTEKIAQEF